MDRSTTNLREISLSKMSDEEPPHAMNETFQGLQIAENAWQIRNVPAVISGISFGDIFEPRQDRPGWKLINRSRYSTIILGPKQHMNTFAGNQMIDESLEAAKNVPNVIFERHESMRCFAVLPENMTEFVSILEEGGSRFWDWAITSSRTPTE